VLQRQLAEQQKRQEAERQERLVWRVDPPPFAARWVALFAPSRSLVARVDISSRDAMSLRERLGGWGLTLYTTMHAAPTAAGGRSEARAGRAREAGGLPTRSLAFVSVVFISSFPQLQDAERDRRAAAAAADLLATAEREVRLCTYFALLWNHDGYRSMSQAADALARPLASWTSAQLSAVVRSAALTINPRTDALKATRAAGEAAADSVVDLNMNGAMVAKWPLEQWAKFCRNEDFALKLTGVLSTAPAGTAPVSVCQSNGLMAL
jgi:hypothetical protein